MILSSGMQTITVLVLVAIWIGVTITLFVLFRRHQTAYLRRFPPIDGVPMEWMHFVNPFGTVARTVWAIQVERQSDPALEQLRRTMWRTYRDVTLWMFGFPLLTFGVAALLVSTGAIRIMSK